MTALSWLVIGGAMSGLALVNGLFLHRRRQLLLDAIHEARRPLAAVMLGLDCVAREAASRRVDLHCTALRVEIGRAAVALDSMVGRQPCPALVPVDLSNLAEQLARAWTPLAARRGWPISLGATVSGDLAEALGDPAEVAQAASNLVANAVEHGSGPVEIGIQRHADRIALVVTNPSLRGERLQMTNRGRGLRIASRLVRRSGGQLNIRAGAVHQASLELVSASDQR